MSRYPDHCSCIQSGGDGRIILAFSDMTIPWKCPHQQECQHLRNMAARLSKDAAAGGGEMK